MPEELLSINRFARRLISYWRRYVSLPHKIGREIGDFLPLHHANRFLLRIRDDVNIHPFMISA
jgi:hypothetical protein